MPEQTEAQEVNPLESLVDELRLAAMNVYNPLVASGHLIAAELNYQIAENQKVDFKLSDWEIGLFVKWILYILVPRLEMGMDTEEGIAACTNHSTRLSCAYRAYRILLGIGYSDENGYGERLDRIEENFKRLPN